MSKEIEELIAEARKCAPGDCSTELAVMVHRLADALEAAIRERVRASELAQGLAIATTLTGSDATVIAKAALELGATVRDDAFAEVERVAIEIEAVAGGITSSSEAAGYRNGLLRAAQIVRATPVGKEKR